MITFTVYGVAQPKGSTKAFMPPGARFPVVTSDNTRLRPWAALVTDAARQALQGGPVPYVAGAVAVHAAFVLPRPKSLPKRVVDHVKKPDLDKLARALKDACTGVLWTDDSQVVHLDASKRYALPGEAPHATVGVGRQGAATPQPLT